MTTERNTELTEALRKIQDVLFWKDHQMANKLGISRSGWCSIRRGHSNYGIKVLGRILLSFPELQAHVARYLVDGVKEDAER